MCVRASVLLYMGAFMRVYVFVFGCMDVGRKVCCVKMGMEYGVWWAYGSNRLCVCMYARNVCICIVGWADITHPRAQSSGTGYALLVVRALVTEEGSSYLHKHTLCMYVCMLNYSMLYVCMQNFVPCACIYAYMLFYKRGYILFSHDTCVNERVFCSLSWGSLWYVICYITYLDTMLVI